MRYLRRNPRNTFIPPHPLDNKVVMIETFDFFIGGLCRYNGYYRSFEIMHPAMEDRVTGVRTFAEGQLMRVAEADVLNITEVNLSD